MIENVMSLWFDGKDNKDVTVASTLFGKEPIRKANRYIKERGGGVEMNEPNAIAVYN